MLGWCSGDIKKESGNSSWAGIQPLVGFHSVAVSSLRLFEQNQVVAKDIDVTTARLPSPLQGKRRFQTFHLILLGITWVCVLWKLILHLGKEKRQFQRREVFDFLFLLLMSGNISTNSQQKGRANVCFLHCYISQAWNIMRASEFTSLVRLAGLTPGFSKPLRVGPGGFRGPRRWSCISVSMGNHES